jgi:glycine dehydrogenase
MAFLEIDPPFSQRHIGPSVDDEGAMLKELGVESIDALIAQAVPQGIRISGSLDLAPGRSESEVISELRARANENTRLTSMIGCGYYDTITPPVIARNILENPAWYTAYTPYQAEISQGRLEALLTFQTMITDLTGLDIANASMLDEATAIAEAMTLARRVSRRPEGKHLLLDADTHPQNVAVVATRAEPLDLPVRSVDLAELNDRDLADAYAIVIQYPGSSGRILDLGQIISRAKEHDLHVIVSADLLALTLLESPGALGADIVVGSAQRFGVPMGYGGPHAGYLAIKAGLERSLPGRLVGVSVDAEGRAAYRLALQTREQHIRREKATSNICTAQVLLAVMAGMYGVWHGPEGLRGIARRVHDHARRIDAAARASGWSSPNETFFDTISLSCPGEAETWRSRAEEAGINIRKIDENSIAISVDETTSIDDVSRLLSALKMEPAPITEGSAIPHASVRESEFLSHPVFHAYRNETAMLRYLRALADKDLALDRTMIPLGSCTMKLNATTEMIPVTWPEFAGLHPFAPTTQATGTRRLIAELSQWLVEVTGYDSVSLQPNAGSQGEFAGLLAIRGYHRRNGDEHRNICLIPSSAHGTNAASAVMAGMKVVVIACDDQGNVDVEDLRSKIDAHGADLAALMVTYPSTHGVFEEAIEDICALVHEAGGQVYVDGANLNALVGLAKPGKFGADVSHLNLHKTFCIPHGGGGPGVGPVAVRAHLAPFLPNHPLDEEAGPETGPGPVSAAPFGSAGILPISWAYIRLMGAEGLKRATEVAILSANYIAARLRDAYPILYTGDHGLIAHEAIIDIRGITKDTGVTVDDIAKRLMDYGFHAPTISFPVAGTMMIEPTESEDLTEIERFIDAMLSIRSEIDEIANGVTPLESSPLRLAPHTALALTGEWDRPYSREKAVFPAGVPGNFSRLGKYWPPVARIDGAHGDRNLVCACPPIESYS